jgi:hypothetical protein
MDNQNYGYTPMHFGDFARAADGALGEWLDRQPPSTSTELATKQYYALVRLLAKHLSKCAHRRKTNSGTV